MESNLGSYNAVHRPNSEADLEADPVWFLSYAHLLRAKDGETTKEASAQKMQSEGGGCSQGNSEDCKGQGKSKVDFVESGWFGCWLTETVHMQYDVMVDFSFGVFERSL